ncbi:MAG: flavodoxin family protein [Deltaproteobacteria bacterium]|jgi:multimeric flavodoxin WrbA|nr:flavodoxin family protein [Deltaproteobacteria bacterium]
MDQGSGVKILGLHMSPREKGSSALLLERFSEGAKRAGASVEILSVSKLDIRGCAECGKCNETGACVFVDDDMAAVYSAWETATRIVVATPVFFYDMPSQGKAILDRSQAFWSRRYMLNQNKEGVPGAKGFLLACGATKGKDLFVPVTLAVKYLFDSIAFPKTFPVLSFRQIETPDKFTAGQLEEAEKAGCEFARQ